MTNDILLAPQAVPGQADPVPHWAGGSNVVFATLDNALKSLGA